MITGELKSQVDKLWDAFWSGGISNPLEVIEQITYLLFIKRLDDLHTAAERKANRLKRAIERPIFNEQQQALRWSHFKNEAPAEMYNLVAERVFPFIRTLQSDREDSTYSHHMKDARFTIPKSLLARVVDMVDRIPMEDRDTKGDLYEYMLGKIAQSGQNGQFRTPRHIIRLMVEMVAPTPQDVICDPACGTAGFLVAAGEYLRKYHQGRYISLERLIETHKERYYETLEQSSQGWHEGQRDPWPYLNFVLYILKQATQEFERRVGQTAAPKGSKTELVETAIAAQTGLFTLQDLLRACPSVSQDLIRKTLSKGQRDGSLECLGRGPGAHWQKKGIP